MQEKRETNKNEDATRTSESNRQMENVSETMVIAGSRSTHWQTAPEQVACAPLCLPRHAACLGSWVPGCLGTVLGRRTTDGPTPRARRSDAATQPSRPQAQSWRVTGSDSRYTPSGRSGLP